MFFEELDLAVDEDFLLEDTLVILEETELVELSDDDKELIPPPTTKTAPTPINIYLVFFCIFVYSLNFLIVKVKHLLN